MTLVGRLIRVVVHHVLLLLLIFVFTSWIQVCNASQLLPTGFLDEGVVAFNDDTFGEVTGFNFLPSGELLVTEKAGRIFIVTDPDSAADSPVIEALDIRSKTCNSGEQGIQQVVAHPRFEETRWVYVYYTANYGYCSSGDLDDSTNTLAVNRVSRFFFGRNNKFHVTTETIILESPYMPTPTNNGGDMMFGHDGYLYVTIGDGGQQQQPSTTSDYSAQRLDKLLGTIVRITDTGETPSDNPFVNHPDATPCRWSGEANIESMICQEIYAYGFRNPRRFALNPMKEMDSTTEFYVLDAGQDTWEEINLLNGDFAGSNYGYGIKEGPCTTNYTTDIYECSPTDEFVDPIFWYEHTSDDDDKGDAMIGGGAFVPSDALWPDAYEGKFLFADQGYQKIFVMTDSSNGCRDCLPPVPDFDMDLFSDLSEIGQPVQLTFGPYKSRSALYYSVWEPTTGSFHIHRIVFELDDEDDNSNPNVSTPDPQDESVFDDPLAPVPVIASPTSDTTYDVGDVLNLSGYATDSNGNTLPDSSLVFEVQQHHSTHWHPFFPPTEGNNLVSPAAPPPEDFLAATNSFLRVLLTATDSTGLSSTTSLDIQPRTKIVNFRTNPPGLSLFLDGYKVDTQPDGTIFEAVSWYGHTLTLNTPQTQPNGMVFDRWFCVNCPIVDFTQQNQRVFVTDGMAVNDLFIAIFRQP